MDKEIKEEFLAVVEKSWLEFALKFSETKFQTQMLTGIFPERQRVIKLLNDIQATSVSLEEFWKSCSLFLNQTEWFAC